MQLSLLLGGLCVFPSSVAAADLVRQRFVSEHPDEQLESVLYLSIGADLADLGYSSTKADKGADYVLTTLYSIRGAEADVSLSLAPAKDDGNVLSSIDAILHLDLSLDDELSSALRRLFDQSDLSRPKGGGAGAEIGGLFTSGLVSRNDSLRTTKARRIETAAYFGGTSFIGDFSEYSRYGATASLEAGLLFLKRSWSLSVGPRVTETRAFDRAGVSGGPLYMSTVGLNLQIGAGAAQAQRLSGCLSGGAAILTVAASGGTLSKTVPYVDGGLQAGFPLGKDFFLGGDVRFLAAFDRELIVMGAVPTISLCKEF
jgi:hypothetical protein